MPGLTMHYEQQGSGEPLILVPYLAADHACYAFQVAEYAKHFTCISVDPRGAGETDNPPGSYSIELPADDIAAFLQAMGIPRAHVSGLALGAATGMWLAARHPEKVKSLSLHGGWTRTDPFLKTVVQGWQIMARALGSASKMVIQGIFSWCFTPQLYAARPDYIQSLSDFVRSRPAQPLEAFIQQSNAVIAHNVEAQLGRIQAPTLVTFGRQDLLTSRFAGTLRNGIPNSEVLIFEECSHGTIYEKVEDFNARTLAFLKQHSD